MYISIGGRIITYFRFADDIVVNAEEEDDRRPGRLTLYKLHPGSILNTKKYIK